MQAKLEAYLRIGEVLCNRTAALAVEATDRFRASGYEPTQRDEVMIALALKMDGAFRCTIDDARLERAESMHHLKTMIECFIYFYSVSRDESDCAAELVLAEAASQHELFFRENPDLDTGGDQAFWESIQRDFQGEGAQHRPSVKARADAHGPELRRWYQAVYRAACQPAHIADLFLFLPNPDKT